MTKNELFYKLTGEENPKFLTKREKMIVDYCLNLLNLKDETIKELNEIIGLKDETISTMEETIRVKSETIAVLKKGIETLN